MSVELLLAIAGAVSAIIAGFWAVATVAGKQFEKRLDERFAKQDDARKADRELYEGRLKTVEGELRALQKQFLEWLAKLPIDYMRREDHIRFETVIMAKLDALGAKYDLIAERLPPKKD